MGNKSAIRVEGLDEFRKAMRELGPEYSKELGQLNKRAAETVASTAQRNYEALHPSRTGRHRAGIRAMAAAKRAQVAIGGARAPGLVGQEFGSKRFPQFPPAGKGNFLYPAIWEERPKLEERYLELLGELAKKAFPE